MIGFETEVIDIIQRTHDVKSFRFNVKEDFDFKPGQFFFVTIKIDGKDATKHFSFSNSPTEKGYIEFTKKITESDFSKALSQLKVGDWAKLKMPYGSFTFEGEYPKVAFLSGGIGITPIRSICKYIVDKRLDTDMVLIYGNRSYKDIAFREDFDIMQKEHPRLKIVHILSEPEDVWNGSPKGEVSPKVERVGHIGAQVINEEISDYNERKFYICGPPGMVETMKKILLNELNFSKENIIVENFMGY